MNNYRVETMFSWKWCKVAEGTLAYCRGYIDAKSYGAPRLAHRIVKHDGKVVEEFAEMEDVCVGMIAGFPTPEQYERAAAKALDMASIIRKQNEKMEARRNP